ncbi:MAG: stationary phase survival protein SurE [Epsilonproteobacteria bacterium]|nr:stationary phase survival protein SurE [Campylobacterota bacterium]NPA89638.1 stationary phase survival protein SurE [Campylobacterota bacterium]
MDDIHRYSNYFLPEIEFKILANFPLPRGEMVERWEEFQTRLREKKYSFGVWRGEESTPLNFQNLRFFNSHGEEIDYPNLVLNFLYLINRVSREQIGVCIDKTIPRVLDNQLPYLIIQRKNWKDLDQNFFIAVDGEILFPAVTSKFDPIFPILKLAELGGRFNWELKRWI